MEPLLAHIRAQLAARHGHDHPMLDEWARRACDRYGRSQRPEVQLVVEALLPLSEAQERAVAALLA